MKLETLNKQVNENLKHVPRGMRGSIQNLFRGTYYLTRKSHIAKTPKTKEETFKEVWNVYKKGQPDFVPDYDHDYFKI